MCVDPATATMITASVVSTTADIINVSKEVKQLKNQAKTEVNQSKLELQEGIEDSRRKKLKSILNMGETTTKIAAGNIMTSSLTALNAVDDEKMNGEAEAISTVKSAYRRASDRFNKANMYYEKAKLKTKNVFGKSFQNIGLTALKSMS